MDILEVHDNASFQIEAKDWWIRARFHELEKNIQLDQVTVLVDIGCGSGVNLFLTWERHPTIRLLGVDPNSTDVSYNWLPTDIAISAKFPGEAHQADVVLLMDVLEHVEDDFEFLRDIVNRVRPGIRFFLSVPAFSQLWSQRDLELGHYRRYTKKKIIRLCTDTGLTVDYCRYRFSFLAVVLFFVKKRIKSTGLVSTGGYQSSLFASCLRLLSWVEGGIPWIPFGTSIILVASKNAK